MITDFSASHCVRLGAATRSPSPRPSPTSIRCRSRSSTQMTPDIPPSLNCSDSQIGNPVDPRTRYLVADLACSPGAAPRRSSSPEQNAGNFFSLSSGSASPSAYSCLAKCPLVSSSTASVQALSPAGSSSAVDSDRASLKAHIGATQAAPLEPSSL